MRHTLKWSFFIGTAAAGIVLALMKLFQPIRFEHLVFFGYAFVGTSLIAGYVAHKNLEKRVLNKTQSVKTDGGSAVFIGVQRVKIGGVPDFVPASELLADAEKENIEDAGRESMEDDKKIGDAENFLSGLEKEGREEIENESVKSNNDAILSEKANHELLQQNGLSRFKCRQAKILTRCGKTITGKFAGMDTHVVLEDAECGAEKKSLLMVSKSEIARMEIE